MNSDRKDLISCAIIKTDIVKNDINYGRSFYVQYDEIESIIKFIEDTSIDLNVPVSRIYISGFDLVSKNQLWTKDTVKNFFNIINNDMSIHEQTSRTR